MTDDSEIKRALEFFKSGKNENFAFVSGNALDLINRQQAEIEDVRNGVKSYKGKYKSANKTAMELQDVIKKKDAEIETLKIQNEHLATFWRETQQQLEDLEKEMVGDAE